MKYLAFLLGLVAVLFGVIFTVKGAFLFLFGWIPYLVRVLPRVTVDWPSVTVATTSLLLFTLGTHIAGRSWFGRTSPEEPDKRTWKWRWTFAVVALLLLMFTSGIAMIGLVHQTTWLATSKDPLLTETVAWADSRNNPRSIGLAVLSWRDTEGSGANVVQRGRYPHSWETKILPFLIYSPEGIDENKPWNHPDNAKPLKCIIPQFINPDLHVPTMADRDGYGHNHYSMNKHLVDRDGNLRSANLSANTILLGEINTRFRPWARPGNFRDPRLGLNRSASGYGGSAYSGGAYFVMGDGSVRFIDENVSPHVLQALSGAQGQ